MPFIEVPFTTDSDALADDALALLASAWDGWDGQDGDLEVIQIETLAPMAAEVAEVASQVPSAIFRQYGLQLLGITYDPGHAAVGMARFTAIDNVGYATDVPAEIDLGGYAFSTDTTVVIPAGATYVDVPITANETGSDYNSLSGFANPLTPLPWLSTIQVITPTSAGTEPETDEDYQNRLADRLQLQTLTLVTGRDFELMALTVPGVGRSMALVNTARNVQVALTDANGELLPANTGPTTARAIVLDLFDDYRQVNTTYSIVDPTYTTINVTYAVVCTPGYDPTAVKTLCDAAVSAWLSPANWGMPRSSQPGTNATWVNETVVRYSELQRTLAVEGVRYVSAATLNGGTADLNLSGTAPLTRMGTLSGTAT